MKKLIVSVSILLLVFSISAPAVMADTAPVAGAEPVLVDAAGTVPAATGASGASAAAGAAGAVGGMTTAAVVGAVVVAAVVVGLVVVASDDDDPVSGHTGHGH